MRSGIRNELILLLGGGALLSFGMKQPKAALALAAGAGGLLFLSPPKESFEGKSVLITGGSRGLGLALATEFAREKAKVAIIARSAKELDRAFIQIDKAVPGADLLVYSCDVTDRGALEQAIEEVARARGGLDVLVNNAGAITIGPFDSMEREDFEAQMDLHFFAVLNACKLALPHLRRRGGARIVNICSMGGKAAVPHMLPYDSSKFALAGFSQGLMAELAEEGISVTTIYPAVMRTGSPIQAVFKGDHEKEFAWFASTDVMPGLSLAANKAAREIVEAARARTTELVPSIPAKARNVLSAAFPEIFSALMAFAAGRLPKGQSSEHRTGADSRQLFDRSLWFWPLRLRARQAERAWNQKPSHNGRRNMGLA
jgi:NAD(P)-dependent dehydrogenase (short-subunit alcohol dehydrogenase family)